MVEDKVIVTEEPMESSFCELMDYLIGSTEKALRRKNKVIHHATILKSFLYLHFNKTGSIVLFENSFIFIIAKELGIKSEKM